MITRDGHKSIGPYWIALYVTSDNVTYLDNFGVKYFPKETQKLIDNNNITTYFCRIQANDSLMCRCFCRGYIIDSMLKSKSFLDHTNLLSPKKYVKNDQIILQYFQ